MKADTECHNLRASYQQRMSLALEHIEKNLKEKLTLEQLSKLVNFSPFHFHRQFRVFVGLPVYKLIQFLRLKRRQENLCLQQIKALLR